MTIWLIRVACWITKATKIICDYVKFTDFPQQNWLQEYARTEAHTDGI